MRKILAKSIIMLFALLLCFGCINVQADYSEELLFRNIPWGTSIDQIKDPAIMYTYESGLPLEESFLTIPAYRSFAGTEYKTGFKANGNCNEMKVGGYPISAINIYCMYGVKNAVLLKTKSDSEFYAADYVFKVIDTKAAYENLKAKMEELYGPGETKDESADSYIFMPDGKRYDFTQSGSYTIWNGANDTHVILFGAWVENEEAFPADVISNLQTLNGKFLYMTYYKGGMNDRLNANNYLEMMLEKGQEAQDSEGYDGL